jgi:hypothetical protein
MATLIVTDSYYTIKRYFFALQDQPVLAQSIGLK